MSDTDADAAAIPPPHGHHRRPRDLPGPGRPGTDGLRHGRPVDLTGMLHGDEHPPLLDDRPAGLGAVKGCAAAAVLAGAIPAHAEGSFSSSMSAVRTGFDSRTWTDKNSDSVSTYISLTGCDNGGLGAKVTNTQLQLTREKPFYEPDEDRGRYTAASHAARHRLLSRHQRR